MISITVWSPLSKARSNCLNSAFMKGKNQRSNRYVATVFYIIISSEKKKICKQKQSVYRWWELFMLPLKSQLTWGKKGNISKYTNNRKIYGQWCLRRKTIMTENQTRWEKLGKHINVKTIKYSGNVLIKDLRNESGEKIMNVALREVRICIGIKER